MKLIVRGHFIMDLDEEKNISQKTDYFVVKLYEKNNYRF